jgi:hypothetical protein
LFVRFLLCPDRTKCCQRSIAKAEEQKQQKSQFDIFLKKKNEIEKTHCALFYGCRTKEGLNVEMILKTC